MVHEEGVQIDSGSGCSIIGQEVYSTNVKCLQYLRNIFHLLHPGKRGAFEVVVLFQIRFENIIFPVSVNLFEAISILQAHEKNNSLLNSLSELLLDYTSSYYEKR